MTNYLYYGDNLEVMRKFIAAESVDLCYIDPPFNSNKDYNMIYSSEQGEDHAQTQAFLDTWSWNAAAQTAYEEIINNTDKAYQRQTVVLIESLRRMLGIGGNLAYLVNMAQRINEIHRVLKPAGSFYLHCDPAFSHYLKLLCDTIFCAAGKLRREVIWYMDNVSGYKGLAPNWIRDHDTIFYYTKSDDFTFNKTYDKDAYSADYDRKFTNDDGDGRLYMKRAGRKQYLDELKGKPIGSVWKIPFINNMAKERTGWATQKPEALLERIVQASSNAGDVVMDCFCGCGTTVVAAQKLGRQWIGIDITYQSISLVLKRIEDTFGKQEKDAINLMGIPRDIAAARALSLKKDDRVRKEFEKWAVLTYSNNRAYINEKKGADGGIDGIADMATGMDTSREIYFQVKSGKVGADDVNSFIGTVNNGGAAAGIFITLEQPTKGMLQAAAAAGTYTNPLTNQTIARLQIVEVKDIMAGAVMSVPMACEVLKRSPRKALKMQTMMLLI